MVVSFGSLRSHHRAHLHAARAPKTGLSHPTSHTIEAAGLTQTVLILVEIKPRRSLMAVIYAWPTAIVHPAWGGWGVNKLLQASAVHGAL